MGTIQEQILEVAKAFVVDHSWPWIEPVEVQLQLMSSGERAWQVRTNVYSKGRNIRLLIQESDFSVIDSTYLPR